jgi:hypothetical protein
MCRFPVALQPRPSTRLQQQRPKSKKKELGFLLDSHAYSEKAETPVELLVPEKPLEILPRT